MSHPSARTTHVLVRVSKDERDFFNKVAQALSLSMSDLVRETFVAEGHRLGVPVPTSLAR